MTHINKGIIFSLLFSSLFSSSRVFFCLLFLFSLRFSTILLPLSSLRCSFLVSLLFSIFLWFFLVIQHVKWNTKKKRKRMMPFSKIRELGFALLYLQLLLLFFLYDLHVCRCLICFVTPLWQARCRRVRKRESRHIEHYMCFIVGFLEFLLVFRGSCVRVDLHFRRELDSIRTK